MSLAMGMILSANSRILAHDFLVMSEVVAEHDNEADSHDHSHDEQVDLMHAYYGHAHDLVDHDHNFAYLRQRASSLAFLITRAGWVSNSDRMIDHSGYLRDRPPRV